MCFVSLSVGSTINYQTMNRKKTSPKNKTTQLIPWTSRKCCQFTQTNSKASIYNVTGILGDESYNVVVVSFILGLSFQDEFSYIFGVICFGCSCYQWIKCTRYVLSRVPQKVQRVSKCYTYRTRYKQCLTENTRLALFYSLIIHCISFVYSSLPRPLSKITMARDRYLTKDFNNGLGSELWTIEIQWTI